MSKAAHLSGGLAVFYNDKDRVGRRMDEATWLSDTFDS
jgi:hypothetical protein